MFPAYFRIVSGKTSLATGAPYSFFSAAAGRGDIPYICYIAYICTYLYIYMYDLHKYKYININIYSCLFHFVIGGWGILKLT